MRDAMLARYLMSSCVRLCVRLSVTSRYDIETTRRNVLVFGMEASFHLYRMHSVCVIRKLAYLQQLPSLWNFVPNSGLRKFRHGKSIALSTELVVVVLMVELVDDTYTTMDESWLFTEGRSTATL